MQEFVRIPLKLLETLSRLIFSPIIAGSLLIALTYAPADQTRSILSQLAIPASVKLSSLRAVFGVLLALGLSRDANRLLNASASNLWRVTAQSGWDDWRSEVAVVTGGCSGIGLQMVHGLLRKGVKVAVLDIQGPPKELQDLITASSKSAGKESKEASSSSPPAAVRYYKCDVTASSSVSSTADAIRRDLGHPTILINNAGISGEGSILRTPEALVNKVFQINCLAHWVTVREFLPHMVSRNHGHVVSVASVASFVALTNASAYSATKAGALAFHECLTSELKHVYKAPGVVTTVVHPSFVRTPLVEKFVDGLSKGGMGLLTPEEVAGAVLRNVFGKRGGQIFVPDTTYMLSGLRGWPTWVQESIRDIMGRQAADMV